MRAVLSEKPWEQGGAIFLYGFLRLWKYKSNFWYRFINYLCVHHVYFYNDKHSSPLRSLLMHGRDYWEPRAVDECDYHTKRHKGHEYIKILDLWSFGDTNLMPEAFYYCFKCNLQGAENFPPPCWLHQEHKNVDCSYISVRKILQIQNKRISLLLDSRLKCNYS